jgi:outer membrane receptor for ferrienterochelin and colicins
VIPLAGLLAAASASPGEIQQIEEFDLEALLSGDIVSSVSKRPERAAEAPAAVTVITRRQLLVWGYSSVAEILQRVVGFYLTDDHMIPNVAVRGITGGLRGESGLLKVMVDGQPVAFRPTGGNWLGPELVPLSAVERIEIVRGPASTVYGADAFLGVINVITREAERVGGADLWGAASHSGGVGGGVDLTAGGRQGSLSALAGLRLWQEDRSGMRLPPSSPAPALRAGVEETEPAEALGRSWSLLGRVTHHAGEHSTLALTGAVAGLERDGDFADWLQLSSGLDADGRLRGTQLALARRHLDLTARLALSERLDAVASAAWLSGSPLPSERLDVGSDVSFVRRDMGYHTVQSAVSVDWRPAAKLKLGAGTDGSLDRETLPGVLQVLYADAGALAAGEVREETSVRQGSQDFLNLGSYALASWSALEPLRLDAGLRLDHHNVYGAQLNWRGGGSVRLAEPLTLKLSYNSAFRAPTPLLLYGTPLYAGDILGNADLQPQQMQTVEADLSYTPAGWLRLETALSYNHASEVASFVPVGGNSVARNLSEIGTLAWESEARLDWEERLMAYGNLTLVRGLRETEEEGYRAELIGDELQVYPPMMANAGVSWTFELPLRLGVEGRYVSARRASDENLIARGAEYFLPAAFYLDGSVSLVDLPLLGSQPTTLSFGVRNALDQRAAHPGFGGIDYPSAPRLVQLQLRQAL